MLNKQMSKNCQNTVCGREYFCRPAQSKSDFARSRFCGVPCCNAARRGPAPIVKAKPCLKGSNNPAAALTEAQVRNIHADPRRYRVICEEYEIAHGTVSEIKCGKTWSHLMLPDVRRKQARQPYVG